MSDQTNNQIEDFISNLEKLNEKASIEGKLPFSGIEYKLKPLTTKQISKINSSTLSTNEMNAPIAFFDVVKTILDDLLELEDDKTYRSFNILDYTYLIFKIRESLDPQYEVRGAEGDIVGEISITERIEQLEAQEQVKEIEFGSPTCKINLYLPSYFRMEKFNKDFERKYKEVTKQNTPDYEGFIKYGFKNMFTLFIKGVKIKVDKKESEVDFHSIPRVSDQMAILDSIPNSVFKDLYKEIRKMTKPIDDLVYFDEDNSIPLDCGFLVTE